MWYNGSTLHNHSKWEELLEHIWIEKKKANEKRKADQEAEADAEADKRELLHAAFH